MQTPGVFNGDEEARLEVNLAYLCRPFSEFDKEAEPLEVKVAYPCKPCFVFDGEVQRLKVKL